MCIFFLIDGSIYGQVYYIVVFNLCVEVKDIIVVFVLYDNLEDIYTLSFALFSLFPNS